MQGNFSHINQEKLEPAVLFLYNFALFLNSSIFSVKRCLAMLRSITNGSS